MSDVPVRFPSPEVFARVRAYLEANGFTEENVSETIREWKRTSSAPANRQMIGAEVSRADLLMQFFRGGEVKEADFARIAGEDHLNDLRALGMVDQVGDDILRASVRVRPMFGLYVLSDLEPDNPHEFRDDFVHAPDDQNTLNYLSYVPMKPCSDFLEACGGSGIAALLAAKRCAQHAWSADIAERSSAYARFAAALNGLENVTVVTGDTYEPVGERTFDRIAIHPPYIPVLRHSYIFHGGGNDGEQITRKHIMELHGRLKPGGRLYCRCGATDRKGEPLEQRVRKWLGEHESEYDIALQVLGYVDPWRFLTKSVRTGRTKPEELKQWEEVFQELGLEKMVMAVFVIQRHDSVRPTFTVRRDEGPYSGPRELEWLLEVETARTKRGPDFILVSRLKANPATMLNIVHTPREGDWQMRNQYVEVLHPFPLKFEVDPLSGYVLPRLAGEQTGMELFQSLVEEGVIAPDDMESAAKNFAAGLAELATGGFLFVEGLEPASAPRKHSEDHTRVAPPSTTSV